MCSRQHKHKGDDITQEQPYSSAERGVTPISHYMDICHCCHGEHWMLVSIITWPTAMILQSLPLSTSAGTTNILLNDECCVAVNVCSPVHAPRLLLACCAWITTTDSCGGSGGKDSIVWRFALLTTDPHIWRWGGVLVRQAMGSFNAPGECAACKWLTVTIHTQTPRTEYGSNLFWAEQTFQIVLSQKTGYNMPQ